MTRSERANRISRAIARIINEENFLKSNGTSQNPGHQRRNIFRFITRGNNDRDRVVECRHVLVYFALPQICVVQPGLSDRLRAVLI